MQVLLIRPAEVAHGVLSARGRDQARGLAERLRWYDCAPTRLWASATAIETAELIAAAASARPHVEAVAWLAQPDALARVLAAASVGMVAVCTDEPVLSRLGAQLVGAAFAPLACAHAARIVDGRLRWRFAWDADASVPATP